MVEIGNYDGFYGEGRIFSSEEVLRLTRETRSLLGDRVPLSVTVPHTLALADQVNFDSNQRPACVCFNASCSGRTCPGARSGRR